jgi:hypothetical protein
VSQQQNSKHAQTTKQTPQIQINVTLVQQVTSEDQEERTELELSARPENPLLDALLQSTQLNLQDAISVKSDFMILIMIYRRLPHVNHAILTVKLVSDQKKMTALHAVKDYSMLDLHLIHQDPAISAIHHALSVSRVQLTVLDVVKMDMWETPEDTASWKLKWSSERYFEKK